MVFLIIDRAIVSSCLVSSCWSNNLKAHHIRIYIEVCNISTIFYSYLHHQVLAGHDDIVSCVTIADHNRNVISGSHDKTLIVWNMSTGEIEQRLKGHTDIVTSAKMTADGSIVVSGVYDST